MAREDARNDARNERKLRQKLLEACRILDHEGLVHGYGHVSARTPDRRSILISPRMAPRLVKSADEFLPISIEELGSETGRHVPLRSRPRKMSALKLAAPLELFAHTEVYRMRPDVNAVCRIHGKFALAMSVVRRKVRPLYELALALGQEIPIFDSPELIQSASLGRQMAQMLGVAKGILLRGNGQIAVGASVEEAVVNAIMLETAAEIQWRALAVGQPVHIEGDEFTRLAKRDYEWVQRPWAYYLSRGKSR